MNTNMLLKPVLITLAALSVSLALHAQALPPVQDTPDGPFYMPGEVLIKFKAEASDAQLEQAVRLADIISTEQIRTRAMAARGGPGLTRAFTRRPVAETIQVLTNHPAVLYAERNWVYTHQEVSNDPYFTGNLLWGMYGDLSSPANPYGSQAAEAWEDGYVGLPTMVVGIIDEGIQITHPDLGANIWLNPGEIPGNGIDDDGNGYIDDIHGYDFHHNDASVYDRGDADGCLDDHGTHVAGTIGAEGGNGIGVAGVNWRIQMISAKFLGPDGGTTLNAVKAVDYFTDLKQNRGIPVTAINNSWGGGGYSQSLHDAIIRAAKAEILFVAASGNGDAFNRAINIDLSPSYPACYSTAMGTSSESAASYDAVISVTAIGSSGTMPTFANYGATTVDLGAPGVGVNSTVPENSYAAYSGTSMATPHVTGAVALYASTHQDDSAAQIKAAILGSTIPTSSLAGKSVTGGRLDLSTVITPPSIPLPPTGLAATAGDAHVSLGWNVSVGAARYNVFRRVDPAEEYAELASGLTTTSYVDFGLANGMTYDYVVTAENWLGESGFSAPASATPTAAATPPLAPSGLTAVALSPSQIALSWSDHADNESGFLIQRTLGSTAPVTISVGPKVTFWVDTGLDPGTQYGYTIAAYNSAGSAPGTLPAYAMTLPEPGAVFVSSDDHGITRGTWKGTYGSAGYHLCQLVDGKSSPYVAGLGANATVWGAYLHAWTDSTTDLRALQRPDPSTDRFAHCYYEFDSFYVDLTLPYLSRVSLYILDWDAVSPLRQQEITITDANDPTLVFDTRSITAGFTQGRYLTWDLAGDLRIKITCTAGGNAVLSGIFFDPAPGTPNQPPTSPANLIALPGPQSVKLSWTPSFDPDGDLLLYDIFRRLQDEPVYSAYPLARLIDPTFTDTGLDDGLSHFYFVRAIDETGQFALSGEVSAIPSPNAYNPYVSEPPVVSPGSVTGPLSATTLAGDGSVQTLKEARIDKNYGALVAEYTLRTSADRSAITALTLHLTTTVPQAWGDENGYRADIYNVSSGSWDNITSSKVGGAFTFTPTTPQNYVTTDGIIRVKFEDTQRNRNEVLDSVGIDLLCAAITANPPPVNHRPVVPEYQSVSVDENSSVAITLTGSDEDGDDLTYQIALAPAHGTLSGTSPDLLYTPNPDYTGSDSFLFLAQDTELLSEAGEISITVNAVDQPPSVMITAPVESAVLQGTVTITATATDDLGVSQVEFFANDTSIGLGTEIVSDTWSLDWNTTPVPNGAYTLTAVATDTGENTSTSLGIGVTVDNNAPPTASFTYLATGLSVTFTDSSTDPDGSILAREWNFGDGGTASEQKPSHTYTAGGTYNVTLTVMDNDGAMDTALESITVVQPNTPPVANAGLDQAVDSGAFVTLDGSGSMDPDGDGLSYLWEQLTGLSVTLSDAEDRSPTFTAPEVSLNTVLTFQLTVGDGKGGVSTDTVDVQVQGTAINTSYVTGASVGRLRNDYGGYLGMIVEVGTEPIVVTELGRWVLSGNSQSHEVKLVRAVDGEDVPGGSVTVDMAGQTAGGFVYARLPEPVKLAANTRYYLVSEEVLGGDQWHNRDTLLTTTGVGTLVGAVYSWEGYRLGWYEVQDAGRSYGPVDLKYARDAVEQLVGVASAGAVNVPIAMSPVDENGAGAGVTEFERTYLEGKTVSLSAPLIHDGEPFVKWKIDGMDWSYSAETSFRVEGNHEVTAVYGPAVVEEGYVTGASVGRLRNDYGGYLG
ncbi:MAG: S8 family serine peptidase, partial [Verrucomicrobia bacterium]|nr:S8 family serine peptidase [Verrucomicrobiota bacterium]